MPSNWGSWEASWAWSGALTTLTFAIHAVGLVAIVWTVERFWAKDVASRKLAFLDNVPAAIGAIVAVALTLALLHAIESVLWAVAYVWLGAFASPVDAVLYSIDSMATRGSAGLPIEPRWRLMGGLEAGNGMLLFGISTAFLFAVMRRLWESTPHAPP